MKIFDQMRNKESINVAIPTTEADIKFYRYTLTNVPSILKQKLSMPLQGNCMYRTNLYFAIGSKVLNSLISFGIPQYLYRYLLDFDLRPVPEQESEPKVFSIDDLSFGFTIWFFACVISSMTLLLEIIYIYLKIRVKSFIRCCIGLFCFLKLLKQILRVYKI